MRSEEEILEQIEKLRNSFNADNVEMVNYALMWLEWVLQEDNQ